MSRMSGINRGEFPGIDLEERLTNGAYRYMRVQGEEAFFDSLKSLHVRAKKPIVQQDERPPRAGSLMARLALQHVARTGLAHPSSA